MRKELSPDTLAELEKHFGTFHDAVIHNVSFELFSKSKPYSVCITVGTQDLTLAPPNNWINLTFEIVEITKFILEKTRNYDFSIIFQLNIRFFDDEIYLDFFPYTENPMSIDDFWRRADSKGPIFIVIGKKCYWQTSPYREQGAIA